ncbi:uncharacterized protein YgbK (DUF1537 family) [Homoserinimonas aerilata]|uniref:Uncharacterized protein YgbK (DUF1537 family) n=2 Tax=Homoserinimonas aerilata TaxID=1162970 RepID=A0A542XX46_9MICO|nr:uncharacterized protein YgbK (DUF1537 family) [Homoserinimonas aerilata]
MAASAATPAGIVADDLTGATDSAVQFARDGWQARLALAMPAPGTALAGSVVSFVTDARAQAPDAARASTARAVAGLREAGARHLFIKIDSTMRGSVSEQVAGALDAWSVEHPDAVAVVCSAYPAMGRTVEGGHILVNGAGVHTTAVGTDPVTPVATSDLAELLPGSVSLALRHDSAPKNAAQLDAAFTGGTRVVVVDAATDADLTTLAEAVALLGPRAVPVGAAGLAVAMSRVWSISDAPDAGTGRQVGRIVVVVSSLHDVSRSQADHLVDSVPAERIRVLAPTLDDALSPDTIADWAARQLADSALPEIVVISSPSERPTQLPSGDSTAAELIADSLATITGLVFAHDAVGALMLLGGEGARAVLDRLGADSLLVHDAIREGIPLGTLEGGVADGVTVVTKAGGFGTPTSVADIVLELLNP